MIKKIIDLGIHPFADTFIEKNQFGNSEPVYPLQCSLDKDSGEIKLIYDTKADERYNLYKYSYTSSNSKYSRNHWKNYAIEVSKKVNLLAGSKVVEIGSNDGFLSKQFQNMGHKVVAVDASEEMSKLSSDLGIPTLTTLFDETASDTIIKKHGCANLVVANNVFNHSNNPLEFAQSVANILNDGGVFVYELPYWLYTIKTKKFDQIYHEHVSYFTVKYSYDLLSRVGLEIFDIQVVDYHGGSLRVFAKKVSDTSSESLIVKNMIKEEEEFGLFDESTYKEFMKNITSRRNRFLKKIYTIKSEGHPIIGVGAAAKGNTFLNFYNLDNTVLDYITDSSEYKQGKYTPLTRIPIVGDEIFAKYDKVYALILSWNISGILKKKLKEINNKIEFLSLSE